VKSQFLFIFIFVLILSLNLVSGTLVKQNDCVNINALINGSTTLNLSVYYPNSSLAINTLMDSSSPRFSYNFCNTALLGVYDYNYFDDLGNTFNNNLEVTGNGKPTPSGIVIVMFSCLFLLIVLFLVYIMIYSMGHLIRLDFDFLDLAYNLGLYFSILALYMLSLFYLGNPQIEDFLLLLIQICAWTNVFIPFIALVLSITIGSMVKKKLNFGRQPRGLLVRGFK